MGEAVTLLTALFAKALPYITAAVTALGALWAWGASKARQGRKDATQARAAQDAADYRAINERVTNETVSADPILRGFVLQLAELW